MNKIGFSHGVLYRVLDVYTKDAFDIYEDAGSEIIEICFNKVAEVEKIDNIKSFVEKYPRKSVHLPTNIKYQKNEQTRDILDRITMFSNSIKADLILVHPDLIEDWDIFDEYPLNWAVENIDSRGQSYRGVKDLKEVFKRKNNWKMVLDLNHCFANDRSMKLADDFINEFKNRIEEIHLSGYVDYHEPLYKTKQNKIIKFCEKIDVPIIIESAFDSIDEVGKEMKYIKNVLHVL